MKKPVTKAKVARKVGHPTWPVARKPRVAPPVPQEAPVAVAVKSKPPNPVPTPPVPVVRLAGRYVQVRLTGTDENVLTMMRLVEDAMLLAGVHKEVTTAFRNRCNSRDVHTCRQARDIAAEYVEIT